MAHRTAPPPDRVPSIAGVEMAEISGRRRSRASVASLGLVLTGYGAGALGIVGFGSFWALDVAGIDGTPAIVAAVGQALCFYAVGVGVLGLVLGPITLVRVWLKELGGAKWSIAATTLGGLLVLPVVSLAAFVVWAFASSGGGHGRPYRVLGRARVAALRPGRSPAVELRVEEQDPATRARLATAWAGNALAEHASIAAFERLTLELTRAGAPDVLLGRCRSARADEVDHTERCFALATAYAGVPLGAGELPEPSPRAIGVAELAVESLVDGCLHEGFSAALAHLAHARASDPAVRATLRVVAVDEAEHAALSAAIVTWAIASGGEPVARAVREVSLPERPPASGDAMLVAGLIGADEVVAAWSEVRARVDGWRQGRTPPWTGVGGGVVRLAQPASC